MSRLHLFLAAVAAAALGAAGMWWVAFKPAPPVPPPALLALEGMGHLVSVKVRYANVIEFTQQITQGIPWTQWELRLGGTQVLYLSALPFAKLGLPEVGDESRAHYGSKVHNIVYKGMAIPIGVYAVLVAAIKRRQKVMEDES